MDDGINCAQETFTKKQNEKIVTPQEHGHAGKKPIESWV